MPIASELDDSYYGFYDIFFLELKYGHTVNNFAPALGYVATGLKMLFGSQLFWTRTTIASRPTSNRATAECVAKCDARKISPNWDVFSRKNGGHEV